MRETKILDSFKLSLFGGGCYSFRQHTHEENGKQYRGRLYKMNRALTDDEESRLIGYDNVRLYRMWGERGTSEVFLADGRLRKRRYTVVLNGKDEYGQYTVSLFASTADGVLGQLFEQGCAETLVECRAWVREWRAKYRIGRVNQWVKQGE